MRKPPDGGPLQSVPMLTEADYRALVDNIRDYAIIMLDPQGWVISWNKGAQRIKGYAAEEIIGRHFRVFYLPAEQDGVQPELELRTAREMGRFEAERWRMRKDGSRFRAHVIMTPLHAPDGRCRATPRSPRISPSGLASSKSCERARRASGS